MCCPDCEACDTRGLLYRDTPQEFVRLTGGPLIGGTRYLVETLRCHVCSKRFRAPVPKAVQNAPKHDFRCASTLAIARYSMGLPLYRIEQHQSMHGIPLKDATQWDVLRRLWAVCAPVYQALMDRAANGTLMHYDDTPGRIQENRKQGLATHTTAFISVYEDKPIHLYFTGRNTAGKNVGELLERRTGEEHITAMMDASPHNLPAIPAALSARFILCYCLVHGRRKFFEIFRFFDKECDFVLDVIGKVYAHDAHCKKQGLTPGKRLHYHQTHSTPLMESLYAWMNNQLLYESCEANGGLGQAVRYMLKHWEGLTAFLRIAGAPLDNSWAERAVKIAIRHRRNSLFYKTTHGAEVGDGLMSLIETAIRQGVNAWDYLNSLQEHAEVVRENPAQWLPWNYQEQLTDSALRAA